LKTGDKIRYSNSDSEFSSSELRLGEINGRVGKEPLKPSDF